MIDEDPQQEEDYAAAADLARAVSGGQSYGEPDMAEISRSLGFGSTGHIGRHKQSEAFNRAYTGQQAAVARQKPINPEAQFYATVGDLSGAMIIQKSKGPSLFTHGEEIDLGSAGNFYFSPAGEMNAKDKSGNIRRIKVSEFAAQSGVKTVPFRGGDQQAEMFRNTLQRTKGLMDSLDELEQAYEDNSLYIGKFNPSETATMAEQLETKILLDAMAVLTGSKSLGGNTSNVDIDMLRTMMPKAASTYFTNMKGNEKKRLAELRRFVLNHVMSAAEVNGIKLSQIQKGGVQQISGIR
jgi:hypothetical protein